MSQQDFIFSNERKHWLTRHIVFWTVCWLGYFLFFHLPLHAIFGWNLNEANSHLSEFRGWWIIKMMVFNSLLAVIVPQLLFTYTILYFILPRFFYKRKKPAVVAGVLVVFIISYLLVAGCFKVLGQLPNYLMGLSKTFPWPRPSSFMAASRDTLTVLPIIAGAALMIKLLKRWRLQEKETEQVAEEKTKAELQLLKMQVHPHFLFNTLNNIYFFTQSGSGKAPEMIKRLTDMLHYILNECNQPLVPVAKETKMIQDYISLEKIRYSQQLDLSVEMPPTNPPFMQDKHLVAPLLLIPFVENSFKHGASKMLTNPYIKIRMVVENNLLHFFITNNHPPLQEDGSPNLRSARCVGNIGLRNVRKRLALLYPGAHDLKIIQEPENFTVSLDIQLMEIRSPSGIHTKIKTETAYAMA